MFSSPPWIEIGSSRSERREAGRARRRNLPWAAGMEWPASTSFLIDPLDIQGLCAVVAQAPTSGLMAHLVGPTADLLAVRDERSELVVADLGGLDHAIEGPWEWDVRTIGLRLARDTQSVEKGRAVVAQFACAYREAIRAAAALEHAGGWQGLVSGPGAKVAYTKLIRGGKKGKTTSTAFPVTERGHLAWVKGRSRILRKELPFDCVEVDSDAVLRMFAEYREALPEALSLRMQRMVVVDAVGRADSGELLVLIVDEDGNDPILLQTSLVRESAWEPYAGDVVLGSDAQRVLLASTLLQVSPDPLLGWSSDVRQTRSVIWAQAGTHEQKRLSMPQWMRLREAEALGSVLGRAHARTVDASALAGYLGGSDGFDRALAESTLP